MEAENKLFFELVHEFLAQKIGLFESVFVNSEAKSFADSCSVHDV
jgi:hypothetical protein